MFESSETTADDIDVLAHTLQLLALSAVEIAVVFACAIGINYLVRRHYANQPGLATRMQIMQTAIFLLALVIVLAVLPIGDSRRGQLLSLLGILLSAAIALSSTTVLGNAMAGIMLRSVRAFKPGDYLRVDGHFGRVTEMDLFHIEIQTESSDLTTLSNVFMITHPFSVMREAGTIISVDLSLGYDVPRRRIRQLLIEAATKAELTEPFVQVGELGDFSVSYRVAGLLTDGSRLIAARSRLREMTLDALHEGGIEIVSPTFMNQRVYPTQQQFIPPAERIETSEPEVEATPDSVVFDKATEAASVESERAQHKELLAEAAELGEKLKAATGDEAVALRAQLDAVTAEAEAMAREIEERQQGLKNG